LTSFLTDRSTLAAPKKFASQISGDNSVKNASLSQNKSAGKNFHSGFVFQPFEIKPFQGVTFAKPLGNNIGIKIAKMKTRSNIVHAAWA
jgi:hypothetical protein